jgi:cell wall-associated NlpC family hydrolase
MTATRDDIVTEAKTWLGTPWHHAADVKGAGVDCAMFLVRVYCDLGLAPLFDPRPYAMQWYLHQGQPLFLEWLAKYAHRVEVALPGDVIMFNFGRHAAHGAIIVDEDTMIHANRSVRRVTLSFRHHLDAKLDSAWSVF